MLQPSSFYQPTQQPGVPVTQPVNPHTTYMPALRKPDTAIAYDAVLEWFLNAEEPINEAEELLRAEQQLIRTKARYVAITGFDADAVSLTHGEYKIMYVATVRLERTVAGKFIGRCELAGNTVQDHFTELYLIRAEEGKEY